VHLTSPRREEEAAVILTLLSFALSFAWIRFRRPDRLIRLTMPGGYIVPSIVPALTILCLLAAAGCDSGKTPAVATSADVLDRRGSLAESWRFRSDTQAVFAEHGMVVSDAPLATQVGVEVLRGGGSAVDAAVATAFALAVVWPTAGNIGGGGFALLNVGGQTAALDFRETAPAASRRDMYLDAQGKLTDKSLTGHLAVGVPGSVAGLWALHEKYGRREWRRLLQPAIDLAANGFVVDAAFREQIGLEIVRLRRFPATARAFLPGGELPAIGSRASNPDLARTLRSIQARGRKGFYEGETADRLLAEMRRGGGIITAADLYAYVPKWRTPMTFSYRGHTVATMPLPSSGGITVAMIAQQLESYDLRRAGWHSAQAIHLQAEAMRRAFAVRNEQLGDLDFVPVDAGLLSSSAFARTLAASISMEHATPSREVSGRVGASAQSVHTTHFSVTDAAGDSVSLTTTLNSGFGSAVVVENAGFVLNNEMDDFASQPGSPNQYGLVQGEANAIAPGKRMLSSMTPLIVAGKDGKSLLVTGASGGPYIITSVFELMSNLLDYNLPVGESMSAPRFHHQHLPDEISLEEGGFLPATRAELERLGHRLTFFNVPTTGWTVAATIERTAQGWEGKADSRLHGLAAGY
jgi:gamma-glutamyltranspeptidase/glutathione hydrolase